MGFEITTSTVIDAPVSRVSSIVFDFPAYGDWNPFVKKISGDSKVGGYLDVLVGPPNKAPMNFKPVILKYEQTELRWAGILGAKFLLVGEHFFVMKQRDNNGVPSTEFLHGEKFTGLLSPLMKFMMGKETEDGFKLMNQALKDRAEKGPQ